jgi:hypothetical protein
MALPGDCRAVHVDPDQRAPRRLDGGKTIRISEPDVAVKRVPDVERRWLVASHCSGSAPVADFTVLIEGTIGPEPHPSFIEFFVRLPSATATGRWRERRRMRA